MSSLDFILRERRFLAYGFLLCFASSFGQTFFIARFNAPMRETFDLGHGDFGLAYSIATLASGLTIIQVGRLVDRVALSRMTSFVALGLAVACVVTATAVNVAMLVVGIYLLRLFGQGLMHHTAMTAMARTFDRTRGTASSVTSLGHAAGEAVLPTLAVMAIAGLGWRLPWLGIAAIVVAVIWPAMCVGVWRRRGDDGTTHAEDDDGVDADDAPPARDADAAADPATTEDTTNRSSAPASPAAPAPRPRRRHWTRGEVTRDPRFYALLPAVMAPGFIATGIFFHQGHILTVRGWSEDAQAATFTAFALAQVPAALLGGWVVDRIGARRVLPAVVTPMAIGLTILAVVHPIAGAWLFMALLGVTAGLTGPAVNAAWAEIYGTRHLGAIRSLVMAIGVFGTAGSPFLLGWLIDRGQDVDVVIAACALGAGLAAALARRALRSTATATAD